MKIRKSIIVLVQLFIAPSAFSFSVSGDVAAISAPPSVIPGNLESSTSAWFFFERQETMLVSDLWVDDLLGSGVEGVIEGGTLVNSYLLHFDAPGDSNDNADVAGVTGGIQFDLPILGVIWSGIACGHCPSSPEYLDPSDILLGNSVTAYPTGGVGRGFEIDDFYQQNGTQDSYVISPDRMAIDVSVVALPKNADQIRIITAASLPEPGMVGLFGYVIAAFFGVILSVFRRDSSAGS